MENIMERPTPLIEKEWMIGDYHAMVIFNPMGHRCGYVGVPNTHPFFEKDYDEEVDINLDPDSITLGKKSVLTILQYDGTMKPILAIDCHGGLTYSGNKVTGMKDDLWYFGFDCAHCDDAKDLDAMQEHYSGSEYIDNVIKIESEWPTGGVIRTLDYCVDECNSMANQLNVLCELNINNA